MLHVRVLTLWKKTKKKLLSLLFNNTRLNCYGGKCGSNKKKSRKKQYTYIYTATNINSIYKLKVFTYTYLKLITHR